MSAAKMLAAGFGLVGLVSPALAATEWSSFTERAQDSQLMPFMQREAPAEGMRYEPLSAEPGAGEATSFITRAEKSQGIHPERAMRGREYASVVLPSEATSFTDRAQMSQGTTAGPARAEELSREQIRLVQRTLNAKGFRTDVTGRLDGNTRSSLASFQRENSLPVSGTLDESTVEALGFDASQVQPVRGSEER
jgi:hypothetical protein